MALSREKFPETEAFFLSYVCSGCFVGELVVVACCVDGDFSDRDLVFEEVVVFAVVCVFFEA